MSINIQLEGQLKKLSGQAMSKDKIIEKLGYTPANEATINANITNLESAVDADIAALNTDITEVESALNKHATDASAHFSGDYNDLTNAPDIAEDNSGEVVYADESGHIIAKIDADGVHTTKLELSSGDVDEQLADLAADIAEVESKIPEIPVTSVNSKTGDVVLEYSDLENAPDIATEENEDSLIITDNSGNIVLRAGNLDENDDKITGIETTTIRAEEAEIKNVYIKSEVDAIVAGKTYTIIANAEDDNVVNLEGTSGANEVTYKATHADSGVTAGTYKSVTVNAKGHVTGGTNPTTLSGFGITDAYTETEVDAKIAEHADAETAHTKAQVGLSNVDNTSDLSKPVSIATQNALNELKEEIVSESDSWTIVDESGNVMLEAGKLDDGTIGLETTKIIAAEADIGNLYNKSEVDAITAELSGDIGEKLTKNLGTDEAGKLLTIDENGDIIATEKAAYLVQSDLLQNDSTKIDYVKNRTHYRTLLENYSATLTDEFTNGNFYLLNDLSSISIGASSIFTYEDALNPDSSYGYHFYIETLPLFEDWGSAVYEMDLTEPALIDTVNYRYNIDAQGYVYIITDVSTLPSAYSSTFSSTGIYFECTSNNTLTNAKFTVYSYLALNRKYIPNTIARVEDVASTKAEIEAFVADNAYKLPTASSTQLGGVKVGTGLSITDGVLSATGGTADAVEWNNVQNKPTSITGYGITDAYTKTEVAAKIAEHTGAETAHTKAQIGLANVDNTSDADKPISTATQTALDALKEEIVTESDSWTVADEEGNILLKAGKLDDGTIGLETTTIIADNIKNIQSSLQIFNTILDDVNTVKTELSTLTVNTESASNKLATIQEGAEVNQNAYSTINVGDTLINATLEADVLTFEAGENIIISPSVDNKKITISSTKATDVRQVHTDINDNLPLLIGANAQNIDKVESTYFNEAVTVNPNTKTINANINGNVTAAEAHITNLFTMMGYQIDIDENGNVNCEYVGGAN